MYSKTSALKLSTCRPGLAVHELLLEGREEALGDGIIEAVAA
jgi:hypothetical protein